MNRIVENINRDKIEQIILDLRNNHGGSDEIGSLITSYFINTNELYLNESILKNNEFIIKNKINLPGKGKINKKIMVLINGVTMSAGEGITYHLKNNGIKVAGLTGTNGSMATVKRKVIMPDNLVISYPSIACLDKNKNILIDSDNTRNGGISPDIKIPIIKENVKQIFNDDKDYEIEFLIDYLKNGK